MRRKMITFLLGISVISAGITFVSCTAPDSMAGLVINGAEQVQVFQEWKESQNSIAKQKLLGLSISEFDGIRTIELPPNENGCVISNRVDSHGDGPVTVGGYYYAIISGDQVRVDYSGSVDFVGGEVDNSRLGYTTVEKIGGEKND